jgi:hypothetical protein
MKMLNICFFLIALLLKVSCSFDKQSHTEKDIRYPDWISPIYYLDTFQIISPRVALVDSVPYIFSLESIEPFEDHDDLINQKGVISYLTPDLHKFRLMFYRKSHEYQDFNTIFPAIAERNSFYFEEMFLLDDSINSIPVYKFVFEPEYFLLTSISRIDSFIMPSDCVISDIIFSKDYFMALAPIFNKRDLRKINNLWFRRHHGRDISWRDYL